MNAEAKAMMDGFAKRVDETLRRARGDHPTETAEWTDSALLRILIPMCAEEIRPLSDDLRKLRRHLEHFLP